MPIETAAKEVSKAVSNDIAVFRTRFDVETGKGRKKRLVPVEAELHVNPVSIAVAAGVGLLGALAGTIAWQGVSLPTPFGQVTVFPGMKDSQLGEDINTWYERQRRKMQEAQTRKLLERDVKLGLLDPQLIDSDDCKVLKGLFDAEGNREFALRFKAEAKAKGCKWAQ